MENEDNDDRINLQLISRPVGVKNGITRDDLVEGDEHTQQDAKMLEHGGEMHVYGVDHLW